MARRYRAQPRQKIALRLPIPSRKSLPPDLRKYFSICDEKIGFLPNVLEVYSFNEAKLRAFIAMYNDLMLRLQTHPARARNDRRSRVVR